jgi:hypothetical protein
MTNFANSTPLRILKERSEPVFSGNPYPERVIACSLLLVFGGERVYLAAIVPKCDRLLFIFRN